MKGSCWGALSAAEDTRPSNTLRGYSRQKAGGTGDLEKQPEKEKTESVLRVSLIDYMFSVFGF